MPVVGVEVNPLVGKIVNDRFAAWSGRPYYQPGIHVNFENARTFVKRDSTQYDLVTVTWVDSGAATGAGAFALTENYLYTVEAFRDYLARTKDDGILAFMRARWSPEYDAIKGIGVVNCLYVNPKTQRYWIIDWRVFDPENDAKSKLTHMQEMFDQAVQIKKLPFRVVLMDAWYATKDLMLHLHRASKIFYCPLKSNRRVDDIGG
jgi:hypothetical protein